MPRYGTSYTFSSQSEEISTFRCPICLVSIEVPENIGIFPLIENLNKLPCYNSHSNIFQDKLKKYLYKIDKRKIFDNLSLVDLAYFKYGDKVGLVLQESL